MLSIYQDRGDSICKFFGETSEGLEILKYNEKNNLYEAVSDIKMNGIYKIKVENMSVANIKHGSL